MKPRPDFLAVALAAVLLASGGYAHAASGGAVAQPDAGTGLPSSIPVRRDGQQETTGAGHERWWLPITVAGGLLGFAVIVALRNKTSARISAGSLWQRFGGALDRNLSHEIQRVASTRLSPRHTLHVVVWNGRQLLLGCTDQSIQLLAESAPGAPGGAPSAVDGSVTMPDVRS